MWLQKWIWERYKELRLKVGLNIDFTFKQAKEILSCDSDQTIYKLLNKLEQMKIIKIQRLKKDKRIKKYRIILDLGDIPYSYLSVPSNKQVKQGFLTSTGSMPVSGTAISSPTPLKKMFKKIYNKKSEQFVIIVPEKTAQTIEKYLVKLIQENKSPEAILTLIKKHKINFDKVINELNSYQRRYLGALLDILNKHKNIKDKLYKSTKKDKRIFSIFPKKIKKIPKQYKKIAKKWQINLNIDVVNIDEL